MKKILLSAAMVVIAGLLYAQTPGDSALLRKMASEILSNGKAHDNLRVLTKQVGSRLSGSAGAEKAVAETARMLKEAGADTVILQECMVPHWVRGAKESAKLILANGKEYPLKVAALGNSVGTPASGVTANVIEVRNFAELDKLGTAGNIRGNIVFYNHPMDPTFIKTFMAYGEAGPYRGRGPSLAAKYGAVGVIVRSLASNKDDHPHTGATVYIDSLPKIPAIAISTNDADYLSRALMMKMGSRVYFKTNCQMLPDVKSYNVIGVLRGSDFPDEVLTVGGHLDSWDLAEGAHDDGTGCVQSIEVIRTFKALGIRPKRTIQAVMFMNEENGGRGGEKYAEEAKKDGRKYVFAIESDAGGFVPRSIGLTLKPENKAKLWGYERLFKPYAIEFSEGGGGADIGPLRTSGTVMASMNPDSQRYFDVHHAETDVFEAVSPRELHLGAFAMAGILYIVSEYGL
jgi:carboxypeptidase Q